jgi:hypothetical protein
MHLLRPLLGLRVSANNFARRERIVNEIAKSNSASILGLPLDGIDDDHDAD